MTECNGKNGYFRVRLPKVEVDFGGATLSSDGGGLIHANLSATAVFYEILRLFH